MLIEPLEPRRLFSSFTLVDSDSNRDIAPLSDGATINLALHPHVNVRANVDAPTSAVTFALDDVANYRTERVAPYAIAGDTNGDYYQWNVGLGSHLIIATPAGGQSFSIHVTVVNQVIPPPPTSGYDYIIHPGQLINIVRPLPVQRVDVLAGEYGCFHFPVSGVAGKPIYYHFEPGAVINASLGTPDANGYAVAGGGLFHLCTRQTPGKAAGK